MNNNSNNNYNFDPITGQQTNHQPIQQSTFNTFQQPVQPPQPKKKSNIKMLIIPAIVIVICVIAGIVLLGNKGNKEILDIEGKYKGTKPNLILATVGHTDAGKTALTSAITKFYGKYKSVEELEKASKVKKNGVIYEASIVEYETSTKHYYQYDMPNHSDYVKSIISGSIKLDGAILVVEANDGIMFQTNEHLELLRLAGVNRIVVYMNNCDMVDDQSLLNLKEMEIRELLEKYGFDRDNTPIIRGSASKAIERDKDGEESIHNLLSAMDSWLIKNENKETPFSNTKFNAHVYVLTSEEDGRKSPFYSGFNTQVSISSEKVNCTITLPDGIDMVMPGDDYELTINLSKAVSLKKGDKIQLLEDGKLIAVGIIKSISE